MQTLIPSIIILLYVPVSIPFLVSELRRAKDAFGGTRASSLADAAVGPATAVAANLIGQPLLHGHHLWLAAVGLAVLLAAAAWCLASRIALREGDSSRR